MKHPIQTAKRVLLTSTAAIFMSIVSLPAITWADSDPTPSPSPTPSSSTNDSSKPPASPDASQWTYNAVTGLWENDLFTWDPVTGQTTPKTPQEFSYNPATGRWDSAQYRYDPASNSYVPNTPPTPTPTPSPSPTPAASSDTSTTAANTPAAAAAQSLNAPVTSGNSGSGINVSQGGTGFFDNYYNASISNVVTSGATSGAALVVDNTNGGSATSGNASAIANVVNILQSAASLQGNLATFTSNINGDVNGDLLIDPAQIASLQAATPNDVSNTAINTTANTSMTNTIGVTATSGDATVSSNTNAGDATSGNANAVADVVNLINSIIAARQSFLGVINIYGNLNGNITVPQGFVDSLLAANNSPTTSTGSSSTTNQTTDTINNALTSSATSGSANVSSNTTAGNATTGNAATNVTILNLTGQKVIASNSLLVFVNVLGKWVGLIMNAPAGTTAAALGGGVTSNTVDTPGDVTNKTTNTITNNIGLTALSGNATVSDNTHAGNATSGNATTSANLANITQSQFGLSNWFGVLFINVFGNWLGNFGVQQPQTASTGGGGGTNEAVFQFVADSNGSPSTPSYKLNKLWQSGSGFSSTGSSTGSSLQNTTLASTKVAASSAKQPLIPAAAAVKSDKNSTQLVAIAIFGVGLTLFAVDGTRRFRQHHNTIA